VLVFDTGNCLSGQPLADMTKGGAMAKALEMMGCNAVALGSGDFGVGWESIGELSRDVSFPFLSANLVPTGDDGSSPLVKPYVILEVGQNEPKAKVAVIGLTGAGNFSKLPREKTGDFTIGDPLASLEPLIEEVRKETQRIIVLSNMTREEDAAVASAFPEIDIIISSRGPLFQMAPVYVKEGEAATLEAEGKNLTGGTMIVSGLDKGRSLGTLDVTLDGEGGIEQYAYWPVAISREAFEEDAELLTLLQSYENEMLKDEAAEVVEEWKELVKGDFGHVKNIAALKAKGEEGIRAWSEGHYKTAVDLLSAMKDSLFIREAARAEWEKFEEDLAKGVPEGMNTSKVMALFEEGKSFYREGDFSAAKRKFRVAQWTLGKMRNIEEQYAEYLEEQGSLAEDGFDMTMDERSLAHFEKALDEQNFDDAFATLHRANMSITQGRNARKWRNLMSRIFGALDENVTGDTTVVSARAKADSLYFQGRFPAARMNYNNLLKMLEPEVEKARVFNGDATLASAPGDRYVGSQECRKCHEREFEQWNATRHAKAFTRMDEASRSDPSCVGCHVVGFGSEDGFKVDAPDSTLAAVGCESCHGRGYLHSLRGDTHTLSPGYTKEMCATCHNPKEGFELDYFPFLVRVMHE
jgi:tetratricopeptide (TPR) repeat protein